MHSRRSSPHPSAGAAPAWAALIVLAGGVLLAGRLSALPGAEPRYTVTALSSLGGRYSVALGINNRGQVVGAADFGPVDSPDRAVLWDDAGIHDLGTLGGAASDATAINDAGQIVGYSDTTMGLLGGPDPHSEHAFLYDAAGMHDLGALGPRDPAIPGSGTSRAAAINAIGQVVGTALALAPAATATEERLLLWQNGVVQPLAAGGLDMGAGYAPSINLWGQILVDLYRPATHTTHPFLWQNGVAIELPTPDDQTVGVAINDRGQVLGVRRLPDQAHEHAVLYDGGGWHDLGTLGGAWSAPVALNNEGQVVGQSLVDGAGLPHSFLSTGGVMLDLESLIRPAPTWDWFMPAAINDRGQIVGEAAWNSQSPVRIDRGILLTPLPPG